MRGSRLLLGMSMAVAGVVGAGAGWAAPAGAAGAAVSRPAACCATTTGPQGMAPSLGSRLPMATQASQIQFAQTYLRIGGRPISFAEAATLVREYPSIPTMTQAPSLGFTATMATDRVKSVVVHPAATSGCNDVGAEFTTGADVVAVAWWQDLAWCYDAATNKVSSWSESGYPWVASWAAWLWHYGGEVTGTGYPRWVTGINPCGGVAFVQYMLIVTFHAGWGPAEYVLQWNIYVEGDSWGGFGTGSF
jgi:hypothetical protein